MSETEDCPTCPSCEAGRLLETYRDCLRATHSALGTLSWKADDARFDAERTDARRYMQAMEDHLCAVLELLKPLADTFRVAWTPVAPVAPVAPVGTGPSTETTDPSTE